MSKIRVRKKHKHINKHIRLSSYELFPSDAASKEILVERSRLISKQTLKQVENQNLVMYVKFKLGISESYGISFNSIKEIVRKMQVTSLPCAPDYISGVINRRGLLISIVDLNKFFHIKGSDHNKDPYIIIISSQNRMMGILVDELDGSDKYDPLEMNATSSSIGIIKPEYIVGLHHGITAILKMEKVIDDLASDLQLSDRQII